MAMFLSPNGSIKFSNIKESQSHQWKLRPCYKIIRRCSKLL